MDDPTIIFNPELLLPPEGGHREEIFMREALLLAIEAWHEDEVPVGAVVVLGDEIIGRGKNNKERTQNPIGHAEIEAIQNAAKHLGSWRLEKAELFVTLEPCLMCAGAIIHARISSLFWGAHDPKTGACESLYNTLSDSRLNHQVAMHSGIHLAACSELLSAFFRNKRRSKK